MTTTTTTFRDGLRGAIRTMENQGVPPVAAEVTRFAWTHLGGHPAAAAHDFIEVDGVPIYLGAPGYGQVLWISAEPGDMRSVREQRLEWMRNADADRHRANEASARARTEAAA